MSTNILKKEDIFKKIIASKKECSFLGVSSLDFDIDSIVFDGKTLQDIFYEKFVQTEEYLINVIVEDIPQLSREVQKSNSRLLIKDLIKKKDIFTNKLRDYFVNKKATNIEPPEDVCRNKLDILFYKEFIDEIENRLLRCGVEKDTIIKETVEDLTNRVQRLIEKKIFNSSTYNKLLSNKDFNELSLIKEELSGNSIQLRLKKILIESKSFDSLYSLIDELTEKGFVFNVKLSDINIKIDLSSDKKNIIGMIADSILALLFIIDQDDYERYRKQAAENATAIRIKEAKKIEADAKVKQRLFVKVFCDEIFLKIIKIDDEYFLVSPSTNCCDYKLIDNDVLIDYFQQCMSDKNVALLTKKGNKQEVVPCYVENTNAKNKNNIRLRIGQRSRDAFNYATTRSMVFVKNVIWALIFDRKGNLLLHKRGMNAKDNQDRWDKSVGGHVSIDDPDSIFGARREIVEELYTQEEAEQGHSKSTDEQGISLKPNPEWIIFLGQWDQTRYPQFSESLRSDTYMKLKDNESYCFKYDCKLTDEKIVSKRILVDGSVVLANCFVDLFFVITAKDFDTKNLQNSEYLLAKPQDIKKYFENGFIPKNAIAEGSKESRFIVTPDLNEMIMNNIWDNDITAFSDAIRVAFSK